MGGIVVGRRPRRGRHQRPVADQLLHPHLAIDADPELRRLRTGAQKRHLVDRQRAVFLSVHADGQHGQRVDHLFLGHLKPFGQILLTVFVHQETDGAAVHAIDRHIQMFGRVKGLKHETVATQRDDHIGLLHRGIAIAPDHPLKGGLRDLGLARGEADLLHPGPFGCRCAHSSTPGTGRQPPAPPGRSSPDANRSDSTFAQVAR